MSGIYMCMESVATICEGIVMLSAVTHISCERYGGKKHRFIIAFLSLVYTGVITILNVITPFSFVTMGTALAFIIISTHFTAKSTCLLRCTAAVITILIVNAIDYICLFIFCMITESPVVDTYSFRSLLNPSPLRCLYLAVDKGIDMLLLTLLWGYLPKLQKISNKHLIWLLCISSLIYAVISILIALILGQSLLAMQTAIMFSCIFSCLCVFFIIALLLFSESYHAQKQRIELFRTADQLINKNYQQLYANHQIIAKRIHDYNHNIKVLQMLAAQEKADETVSYAESLLGASYKERHFCKSGNNVIDAIINCKAVEAEETDIQFSYKVDLDSPILIDPVDICAILSNQIENAFDACKRIDADSKRKVSVDIWVKNGTMVFCRVANYVETNPLELNPNLHSTKNDKLFTHGMGLLNISDTAKKYNGALSSEYHEHNFISTVFLCL